MKLQEKIQFHKPITTSREFFKDNVGVKCVHYGDIYKNYSGKTIPSSRIINNFANEVSSDKLLYCDSIIVPDVTETVSDWGHFTYIKYDGTPYINGTHAVALTCESEDELKYIFRYLSSNHNRKRLQTLLNGSTVFQISIKDFGRFLLENYHESQDEQSHIVDILGSIDGSIENNEKIAANLEDYAISKYQEITRGTSNFITLGEIVDIYDSKRKPLSSRERESRKGDYRYYGATGVLDYVNDYLFDGEYVLLAEDGTVIDENGYPIVQLVTGQFWVNNHAHIMQAKAGYTNYSLYVALKKLSVNTAVTGAVQLKINQANLCALEMPRIDENKLLTFNQEIEPLFLKIIQIRAEIEKLNELKQLYLHKFFGRHIKTMK